MRGAGDQRRRGRGERAATAAIEAREAAGTAFYDMDQAQKYLQGRVTVFADLDAKAAAPLQREYATLGDGADAAAVAYIAALDANELGDDRERGPGEYDSARQAFVAVTDRLKKLTADLNRFAERLAPQMARLEAALDQLPPRLTAARAAVAAAETAIETARAGGMDASDPAAELARAREELALLSSQGLGGLGLAGAMEKAEEVRRIAGLALEAAEELPRMGEKVRNSLASVRTRSDMVAGRVEPVRQAMKLLLRNYSQACWQDLKGAPEAVQGGVERARERLNEASRHVASNEWKPAQRALTAARTELNAADRRAGQVTGRVAELDTAAADPGKPAETARFAVRDAQKLAIAQPGGAAPHHAGALDALVQRLERAPRKLVGAHPDYWSYLKELDAIKTEAGDVVARIRSDRAAGQE